MAIGRMPSRQRALALRSASKAGDPPGTKRIPAGPTPRAYDDEPSDPTSTGSKPAVQDPSDEDDDEAAQEDDEGDEDSPPSDPSDSEDEWKPDTTKASKRKKRSRNAIFLGVEGDSESSFEADDVSSGDERVPDDILSEAQKQQSKSAKGKGKEKAKEREIGIGFGAQSKKRRTREGSVYDAAEDSELVAIPAKRPRPPQSAFDEAQLLSSSDDEGGQQGETRQYTKAPAARTSGSAQSKSKAKGKGKKGGFKLPTMTEAERQLEKMKQENKNKDRRLQLQNDRELREAQKAADLAWEAVRQKKAAAQGGSSADGLSPAPAGDLPEPSSATSKQDAQPKETHSLTSWLGLAPKTSEIPDPTTCAAAQIVDRNSLFIGYVYPLESSSTHHLAAVLQHLTRRVHTSPANVPVDKLPPALREAAPSKRGATHDMYAWRVLQLKSGRDGTGGPDDFRIEEGNEDDGEKWGSGYIKKAMEELGAIDCICIVSRWYGGEMLGVRAAVDEASFVVNLPADPSLTA